ncbi:MAG: NUDIX hydrolase [Bacteroidia bacterium]|nr:NUDIX hydrolase [Bacteroidia bacterium]
MSNPSEEIVKTFGHRLRVRVCGICIQDEKVLLVKHRYLGKEKHLWAPPGGGLQLGESAEETLVREFREETGLEISLRRFLFVNEFLDLPLHAIELFFEVAIEGGVLGIGQDPEMSAESQIIERVDFLSLAELDAENPLQIHSIFHNIEKISMILEKQGYYLAKN